MKRIDGDLEETRRIMGRLVRMPPDPRRAKGKQAMSGFYVKSKADEDRCRESWANKLPITITGETQQGAIRAFTGVVINVVADKKPGRWWISMKDSE